MIKLDGSYLEGGGQIVRTALALSTLTGKPFEVTDIRRGRPKPGLKAQHIHCVKSLQQLCSAKAEGTHLGSEHLKYYPGKIQAKTISVDIGTAGSISLLLQALLLPSLFADKKVRLKLTGGTDGKWAMPYDFFKAVFLPQIKKYADIKVDLIRRGYYPKGGGKVEIKINPKYKLSDFNGFDEFWKFLKENTPKIELTEQGTLQQIKGISHASKFLEKAQVSERQAKAAKLMLSKYSCPVDIRMEYCDTFSPGSGITVYAIFSEDLDVLNPVILGSDALGERGKPAEKIGQESANDLIKQIQSKAAVDSHMADNLIPILGLVGGKIKVSEITNHTKTNIYTVEKFLGKIFTVDEKNKIIIA